MDRIVSMYWDNIDPRVVDAQRDVFAHFGLSSISASEPGVAHGDFLDGFMAEIAEKDVALLMDIDCFPLNREIVDKSVRGRARRRDIRLRAIDGPCRSGSAVRRSDVHGDFAPHMGQARAAEFPSGC